MKKNTQNILAVGIAIISTVTLLPVINASAEALVTITANKFKKKNYPDTKWDDCDSSDDTDDDDTGTNGDAEDFTEYAEEPVVEPTEPVSVTIDTSAADDEEAATLAEDVDVNKIYIETTPFSSILEEEEFRGILDKYPGIRETLAVCESSNMQMDQVRDLLRRSMNRQDKINQYTSTQRTKAKGKL